VTVTEQATPSEAAALVLMKLERLGAIFTLHDDETFHCDLNHVAGLTQESAEQWGQIVLSLRDEIRSLLMAGRTRH
jgi:hypothetical protein